MRKNRKIIFIFVLLCTSLVLFWNIKSREKVNRENDEKISSYMIEEIEGKKDEEQYIGFLDIPVIRLKRGFYSMTSEYNNVNKNIQVIADDMDNLLILAAHRGNSKVSFFQNLEKLSLGDEIYLNYKHSVYKYRLYYKYYEKKRRQFIN